MSNILEFRNVGFAHGARAILENLSFCVKEGETVALIGPNGVGKTTLLRLAAGLLRPACGEIVVRGRELSQWGRKQLSCNVALVPQHLEVPFAFRVDEIVAQGRVPHLGFFGRLSGEDRDAIESAMAAVDIVKMRDRVFAELSGGERQRVKIAIGLAQQPKLMLLDEPTQHLDLGRQIELMSLLRRLVDRGITIVAAVHDLALVRENCSSGILLIPNAPAVAGSVSELLRVELLERAFCVDRPGLDRYLAADGSMGGPDRLRGSESEGNDGQENRERLRPLGEQLASTKRGRYPRHTRHGRHQDKD
jgi:iron complex transport system ATP-binding protein